MGDITSVQGGDGSSYSTIGAMHVIAERVGGVNDIDSIQGKLETGEK